MTEKAWPFLIGRGRDAGYRAVVVPEFMAEAASTNALTAATGPVDGPLPSGAACVRELHGLDVGPISVVYRSFSPHGGDYGLDDEGELSDGFGRRIRVTEGLVVRRSAARGAPLEICVADLERVHAEVAGAYRDFWELDQAYVRRTAGAIALGDHRSAAVRLVATEPWRRERERQPGTGSLRPFYAGADREAPPRRSTVRRISLATAAAAVVAGIVFAAVLLTRAPHTGPVPPRPRPAATACGPASCVSQNSDVTMDRCRAPGPDAGCGVGSARREGR